MDVPHVVILPFPAQGHVKPMFLLGKMLCNAGFAVTLVNTEHIQSRMLNFIDEFSFCNSFPRFRFMTISDGLPEEHPRGGLFIEDLLNSVKYKCKPKFKDLIVSLSKDKGEKWQPPTCIIADGMMAFAIDVAEELNIPVIAFRGYNATCTWVCFHLEELIQSGDLPFLGNEDGDQQITCIPGMETTLRRRDLPSVCRLEPKDPLLQFFISQTSKMKRAKALILNTFEELEAPMISNLRSIFPNVYTIGPLHGLLKSPPSKKKSLLSNCCMREQDMTCMAWLDYQPSKSVLYVNFGSVVDQAVLSCDQLIEFWHGLVNSEKPFLWVIRPDLLLVDNKMGQIPAKLIVGASERGCIVGWAPQEEVLAHPDIGVFLTHSGWNATLESIWAGVPMICWPLIADQQVNSWCVGEIWRTGLDMKDTCDRSTVEKMVRDLMEGRYEEITKSTAEFALMARNSIREGGSSCRNIEKLIEEIKSIN